MDALNIHFLRMQDMSRRFLEPIPYVDIDGNESPANSPAEAKAFVSDMIYMLDGPEQRAVQSPSALQWDDAIRGPRMSDATGRVIFKYQMPVLEEFTMDLPAGAEIIRLQDQGGMFWMWAAVDTNRPDEKRYFRAFKTGAKMPDGLALRYVGFCAVFVQMELGLYIFEEIR